MVNLQINFVRRQQLQRLLREAEQQTQREAQTLLQALDSDNYQLSAADMHGYESYDTESVSQYVCACV